MIVDNLASFAANLNFSHLPTDVLLGVKRSIIDTIGVAVAAVHLETSRNLTLYLQETSAEGRSAALGTAKPLCAASAAFLNGTLAHSLDFDDTHLPTIVHASACTLPAALAAVQKRGGNWGELIAAVAAGNEIAVRMGMALYDADRRISLLTSRGLHPTSICGTIGSAAAAAKALDLSEGQIAHAIAIAVSMASGIIEPNRGGGNVKRMYPGWAAQAGVTAAELAKAGFTGPRSCFEGRFGFFAAYVGDRYSKDAFVSELGARWEQRGIGLKPYPCNIFTHSAIAAAVRLRRRGIDARAVSRILVKLPSPSIPIVGDPIEAKRRPGSGHEARFSIPFTVARALLGGGGLGVGMSDFTDEMVQDCPTLELASRVDVVAAPELESRYPETLPAEVTAWVGDQSFSEVQGSTPGSAGTALDEDDLLSKLSDTAPPHVAAGAIKSWMDRVLTMEMPGSTEHLVSLG